MHSMENQIGLAEALRLDKFTDDSKQNFESWDSDCGLKYAPSTLLFASKLVVKCKIRNMYLDYYSQFHIDMDFCLNERFST